MARPKSLSLTEGELRLMDVIWDKGRATVAEVAEALPKELDLAYNTARPRCGFWRTRAISSTPNPRKAGRLCIGRW